MFCRHFRGVCDTAASDLSLFLILEILFRGDTYCFLQFWICLQVNYILETEIKY